MGLYNSYCYMSYVYLCFLVDMEDFCVLRGQGEGSNDEHGYINHNYHDKNYLDMFFLIGSM